MFISGRIEFLGKHTDYCGGQSLVCAIDRGFFVDFEPHNDDFVKLINEDTNEVVEISFDENRLIPKTHWAKYPQTVIKRITNNFKSRKLLGAEINFRSDLPQAAGLSSSSALMISVFWAISKANNLKNFDEYEQNIRNNLDLAEYLGCVENGQNFRNLTGEKGVGTFGGSQDHAAILCGKKNTLSCFKFSPLALENEIRLPKDLCFVVASSGVVAEKTGRAKAKFNRLALISKEIVNKFDENLSLAQVIENVGFETVKKKLVKQELINRLTQFYVESFEIIPKVSELLKHGEVEKIGELVDLSHRNADEFLGNQMPETNLLQSSARKIGALASSAFGAGFGGSVYALVKKSDAEKFLDEWRENYLKNFPQHREKSEFFITKAGESKI
jgi:galactokinase